MDQLLGHMLELVPIRIVVKELGHSSSEVDDLLADETTSWSMIACRRSISAACSALMPINDATGTDIHQRADSA